MRLEIYQQERENFKLFSKPFLALKQAGKLKTVNDGLLKVYMQQGHTVLKTWKQWQSEGKGVKSGQKPFYYWGSKRTKYLQNGTIISYFPMIVLYSENQVFTLKNKGEKQ